MTVGSLALPFAFSVPKDMVDQAFFTIVLNGERRRYRLAAVMFLVLLPIVMYAMFRESINVWMLLVIPALILIALIEILPDRTITAFVIPVGRVYLIAAGILIVVLNTLALLHASIWSEMLVRSASRNGLFVWGISDSPDVYWPYVVGSTVINFAFVRVLREWFILRKRRGTPNPYVQPTPKIGAADAER